MRAEWALEVGRDYWTDNSPLKEAKGNFRDPPARHIRRLDKELLGTSRPEENFLDTSFFDVI